MLTHVLLCDIFPTIPLRCAREPSFHASMIHEQSGWLSTQFWLLSLRSFINAYIVFHACRWRHWTLGGPPAPDWQPTNQFLTHWGQDKMADVFQTTFSNVFPWMKMHGLRLRFHWSLFLMFVLIILQHGSDNGLAPTRQQAIFWTNDV